MDVQRVAIVRDLKRATNLESKGVSGEFNLVPRVYSAFKMAAGRGEDPGTRW